MTSVDFNNLLGARRQQNQWLPGRGWDGRGSQGHFLDQRDKFHLSGAKASLWAWWGDFWSRNEDGGIWWPAVRMKGLINVSFFCRPPDQKEVDEDFHKQLDVTSIFAGPDIQRELSQHISYWLEKQQQTISNPRSFKNPRMAQGLLDLILTNNKEP